MNSGIKTPYKCLGFSKSFKAQETVNESFLKGALQKFLQNLWYLIDEIAVLAHFEVDVDEEIKDGGNFTKKTFLDL